MIRSIRHKGVKSLVERDDRSKLPAENIQKISNILSRLQSIKNPQEMNNPGSDFHQLKGDYQGFYSVKVRANWKIIFRFDGEDVIDIDYVDYH